MGWKHCQTVDNPKWEPQAGREPFGIRLLILHFKFKFSKSIKSLTFHIFLNLTYPLRKKNLFPSAEVIIAGAQIFKAAASRFVNVSEEEI